MERGAGSAAGRQVHTRLHRDLPAQLCTPRHQGIERDTESSSLCRKRHQELPPAPGRRLGVPPCLLLPPCAPEPQHLAPRGPAPQAISARAPCSSAVGWSSWCTGVNRTAVSVHGTEIRGRRSVGEGGDKRPYNSSCSLKPVFRDQTQPASAPHPHSRVLNQAPKTPLAPTSTAVDEHMALAFTVKDEGSGLP